MTAPLVQRLRSVPLDAQMQELSPDGLVGTAIPVGQWCAEAAQALAAPMTDNTEREQFEAWASDEGKFPKAVALSTDGKNYALGVTQTYWLAWQASRATLPKPTATPEPYLDGVNVERLRSALSRLGLANGEGQEHAAANMASLINRLTHAVMTGPYFMPAEDIKTAAYKQGFADAKVVYQVQRDLAATPAVEGLTDAQIVKNYR